MSLPRMVDNSDTVTAAVDYPQLACAWSERQALLHQGVAVKTMTEKEVQSRHDMGSIP